MKPNGQQLLQRIPVEELNLAFKYLAHQLTWEELPPNLVQLDLEEWQYLGYLLAALELERKQHRVH